MLSWQQMKVNPQYEAECRIHNMRGKSDGKQKGAENRPAYFENRNSMETEIANDMLEQFDDLFEREK